MCSNVSEKSKMYSNVSERTNPCSNARRLYPYIKWDLVESNPKFIMDIGPQITLREFDQMIDRTLIKAGRYSPSWVPWTPANVLELMTSRGTSAQDAIEFICNVMFPWNVLDEFGDRLYALEMHNHLNDPDE
jgi:hypothetical protein